MERTVVVFHFGRSGSRVLGKLLGQHPDIGWGGEVLKTPEVERFRERLTDPESYDPFDHLATLCEEREKPWLGIEIKFFHLRKRGVSLEDFVSRVAEMGCRHFVVLQRRNVLRKIVSSMVAKQTRSYHQAADKAAELNTIEIDPAKVEIDAESKPLLEFLDSYAADFARLGNLLSERQVLEMTYEDDILEDPRHASARLCEFLGLPVHEPEVPFGRTNPFPLSEIVTNLDLVRSQLEGTPYAWMAE